MLRGGAGEARLGVGMGLWRGVVELVVGVEILSEEEGEQDVWQVQRDGRSGQERRFRGSEVWRRAVEFSEFRLCWKSLGFAGICWILVVNLVWFCGGMVCW